jgi:hypothetical protein
MSLDNIPTRAYVPIQYSELCEIGKFANFLELFPETAAQADLRAAPGRADYEHFPFPANLVFRYLL